MPADSYSARLRLRFQATGGNNNTWGSLLNTSDLQLVEDAICGAATIVVAASDVTLSTANGATDQARMAVINLTGTPTGPLNLNLPSGITKQYLVLNGTGQVMTAQVLGAGGSVVPIQVGINQLIYCDGTNVITPAAAAVGAVANALALIGVPGAKYARLDIENNFTAAQGIAFSPLTDGATITANLQLSNNFFVQLAGNRTLVLNNPADGQTIELWIQQDGIGGRTLAFPGNVHFEANNSNTLSGTALAIDRFKLTYNLAQNIYIARTGLQSAGAGTVGINIATNEVAVDLFARAGSPGGAVTVNVTVAAGVTVTAPDNGTPAFDTTGFASGSTINLVNLGYILGKGGDGGFGAEIGQGGATTTDYTAGKPGTNGGPALRAPGAGRTFNVTNGSGFIWGGGGGGGGGGAAMNGGGGNVGNGGGGGGGSGGGRPGLGGTSTITAGKNGTNGNPGSTGRLGTFGTGGAGNGTTQTGGGGGSGGDWGAGGAAGTAAAGGGVVLPVGAGSSGGKAIDLNGGTVNLVSGGGGPNIKGLIA